MESHPVLSTENFSRFYASAIEICKMNDSPHLQEIENKTLHGIVVENLSILASLKNQPSELCFSNKGQITIDTRFSISRSVSDVFKSIYPYSSTEDKMVHLEAFANFSHQYYRTFKISEETIEKFSNLLNEALEGIENLKTLYKKNSPEFESIEKAIIKFNATKKILDVTKERFEEANQEAIKYQKWLEAKKNELNLKKK
jgi:hypothetical protein